MRELRLNTGNQLCRGDPKGCGKPEHQIKGRSVDTPLKEADLVDVTAACFGEGLLRDGVKTWEEG